METGCESTASDPFCLSCAPGGLYTVPLVPTLVQTWCYVLGHPEDQDTLPFLVGLSVISHPLEENIDGQIGKVIIFLIIL